jgi:hypothetical protein
MKNPFKLDGEMLPVASINSVYVDDVKANDMFRPTLMLEDIIKHKDALGISNVTEQNSLLSLFNQLLVHELDSIRNQAYELANNYGDRLAKVLSTLFNPSEKSKKNRTNWTSIHWDYWKTIQHIYLVGGLTSPILTKIFLERIQQEFKKQKIEDVTITFVHGSQNMGTRGLSTLVKDGEYLLFDFGQTNIKRAHHIKQDGNLILDVTLEPLQSKYLFYKTTDDNEVKKTASLLDDYLVDTIEQTAKEVHFTGTNIFIAIANYVSKGTIYSARGGYGKLAFIADNYQTHLQTRLSKRCKREINVSLFHDTSAMALLYDSPNTAVISLGTAFGVAFPSNS